MNNLFIIISSHNMRENLSTEYIAFLILYIVNPLFSSPLSDI